MDVKARLITGAAAALAAFAVSKTMDAAWKLTTGQKPPTEEDDSSLTRLLAFAAASAVAVALAQRYATRGATKFIDARGL